MNLKSTTLGELFGSPISFKIPVYQRAYSWEHNNWEVFLEDIMERIDKNNNYSYGNILLEEIKTGSEYEIIDGQQRLSTLIVFMRALINVLVELQANQDEIDNLTEDFMIRRGIKKLRPVDYDQMFFDTVIINNQSMTPASDSQKRYINALNYFTNELKKLDLKNILKIKDILLSTSVNRLELEGKPESALMFELQNNRGLELTNLEKLKSYFMYQIYANSNADETQTNVELISNYFKEIYKIQHEINDLKEDSILIYHCNAYLKEAYGYRSLNDIKKEYKVSKEKVKWIIDFTYSLVRSFKTIKELEKGGFKYYEKLKKINNKNTIAPFAYAFILKGYGYIKRIRNLWRR